MTEGAIPMTRCVPCARDVVVWVRLDAAGDERSLCVHCDAELDPALVRWVPEEELDAAGYAAWGEADHCGKPDCGGGRCGRG
jgi:hypothetical protein